MRRARSAIPGLEENLLNMSSSRDSARTVVAISLAGLGFANGIAAPADVAGTAFYSNLVVNRAEGEAVGWIFQVMHADDGIYVLVREFEGDSIAAPCLSKAVQRGSEIQISFLENCWIQGRFRGIMSKDSIIGSFDNGIAGSDGKPEKRLKRLK